MSASSTLGFKMGKIAFLLLVSSSLLSACGGSSSSSNATVEGAYSSGLSGESKRSHQALKNDLGLSPVSGSTNLGGVWVEYWIDMGDLEVSTSTQSKTFDYTLEGFQVLYITDNGPTITVQACFDLTYSQTLEFLNENEIRFLGDTTLDYVATITNNHTIAFPADKYSIKNSGYEEQGYYRTALVKIADTIPSVVGQVDETGRPSVDVICANYNSFLSIDGDDISIARSFYYEDGSSKFSYTNDSETFVERAVNEIIVNDEGRILRFAFH